MTNPNITITIADPPDREELVAELWVGDHQLAELSREGGIELLEIYPWQAGPYWVLDYEEFLEALQEARRRLTG
jgi:hypothetical protein